MPFVSFISSYNIYKAIKGEAVKVKVDGKSPLISLPGSISKYILRGVKKEEIYYLTGEELDGSETEPIIF